MFLDLIESTPLTDRPLRILDVGGTEPYWRDKKALIFRPVEITLLNLEGGQVADQSFVVRKGNGCHMPEFADDSFDVVHSNSVIEHAGLWTDMLAMANEIRRVAPSYFVQTPNFWFPIEPHAHTPVLHWLPEPTRLWLVMTFAFGPYWSKERTVDEAMRQVQDSQMLNRRMLAALFPDATIIPERPT